jgi:hypothetical protein
MNPDALSIFAVGCLGAASPEIVRLYRLRSRKVTFNPFYLLVSVLFIIVGGVVARTLPTTTLWGAFYVGAGWPGLISSINRKGGAVTRTLRGPDRRVETLSLREYLSFW